MEDERGDQPSTAPAEEGTVIRCRRVLRSQSIPISLDEAARQRPEFSPKGLSYARWVGLLEIGGRARAWGPGVISLPTVSGCDVGVTEPVTAAWRAAMLPARCDRPDDEHAAIRSVVEGRSMVNHLKIGLVGGNGISFRTSRPNRCAAHCRTTRTVTAR